jgi:hypothetical protein
MFHKMHADAWTGIINRFNGSVNFSIIFFLSSLLVHCDSGTQYKKQKCNLDLTEHFTADKYNKVYIHTIVLYYEWTNKDDRKNIIEKLTLPLKRLMIPVHASACILWNICL